MADDQNSPNTSAAQEPCRLSAAQQLDNLIDALCDDILAMSDAEVIEEFLEDGGDLAELEAYATKIRAMVDDALASQAAR